MLGRASYPHSQIAACRAVFDRIGPISDSTILGQLVVALDGWFTHRLRSKEGKDGNVLNEVRLLALGLVEGGGLFPVDKTIQWRPDRSITGLRAGDPIRLTPPQFQRLTAGFLDDITRRYGV